jgi:lipopolysaccharide/colanic/teichoic acid biosynthesis glycosyltransferase
MSGSRSVTDVKPVETSFAAIAQDELIGPGSSAHLSVPVAPAVVAPDARAFDQERIIQHAYRRLGEEEAAADAPAQSKLYRVSKRALDITLTLPALILFTPLMLIIAGIIRLDSPGPALFKQQRVGQNGRLFTIYKFRSMTVDAGVRTVGIHKSETDTRVTRVGQFIRKTSLDELPQLINVVLGQMSLVGPRPELPEIVLQRYEPWQYRRLSVPQGITGWWQVTGRGKKLLWKHTADDLYYVDRASFWFDMKVLLMTVAVVLRRDGAF